MSFRSTSESLVLLPCTDTNASSNSDVWLGFKLLTNQFYTMDVFNSVIPTFAYYPWVWSIIGSIIVGLSGIFPLLVIPIEEGANLKKGAGAKTLKVLLSFAVGGLLGDIFLHLLPEAWMVQRRMKGDASMFCGLWVLTGLLVFIIVEKMFSFNKPLEDAEEELVEDKKQNGSLITPKKVSDEDYILNNNVCNIKDVAYHEMNKDCNGVNGVIKPLAGIQQVSKLTHKEVAGYLNLMANCIDNFTHGLAVGGSFLLSARVGALTTFAILIHEVPHEVGDFAILLRAGFSRWDAAKAQLFTASSGLIGSLAAIAFSGLDDMENRTSWILPFTAGGFLHIALVTVLPELVQEENPRESFKQMFSLVAGITVMAIMTAVVE